MPISIARSCASCQFYQSFTSKSGACSQYYDLRVKSKWTCEKFERYNLPRDMVPKIPLNTQSDPELTGWKQKYQRERRSTRYLAEHKIVYAYQEAAKTTFLGLNPRDANNRWDLHTEQKWRDACNSKPLDLQRQLRVIIKDWKSKFLERNPPPNKTNPIPEIFNRFTDVTSPQEAD